MNLLEVWIPEFPSHSGSLLDLRNPKLHAVIQSREKVTANDKTVFGRPDSMYPPSRDEHRISFIEIDSIAFFRLITKESPILRR